MEHELSKTMDELERKLKQLRHIAMSRDERARMYDTLSEYTKMNPVRDADAVRHLGRGDTPSLLESLKVLLHRPMPAAFLAVVVALTAGGSVSLAAESAVPGDVLYPVKVSVNEQVRSAVAVSNEAEAQWQARLAERRIEEAEQLAAEGELNSESRAGLESRFLEHVERFETHAAAESEGGDDEKTAELATRFRTTLEAHEGVLARLSAEERIDARVRAEIDSIALRIRSELAEGDVAISGAALELGAEIDAAERSGDATTAPSVAAEERAEVRSGTDISARARIRAAEQLLDAAEAQFERLESRMSAEARARLEAKIASANELLAESKTQLESGAYEASLERSRMVMRLAVETRVEAQLAAALERRFGPRDDETAAPEGEGAADGEAGRATEDDEVDTDEQGGEDDRAESGDERDTDEPTEEDGGGGASVEVEVEGDVDVDGGSGDSDIEIDTQGQLKIQI